MSSFYYLSQASQLQLLPGISIACTGPVGSVLFFSKVELRQLGRARIACTAQSATSVNLLKVLLWQQCNLAVELQTAEEPDLTSVDVDAALVIGDRALAVDAGWSERGYLRIDLGRWWTEAYGLPMVFGVWAASREWATEHPNKFAHVNEAHITARRMGMETEFQKVVAQAASQTGLSTERLERYFRQELDFELGIDHLKGLELYRRYCADLGLL
jgi:chorismate dehydratase